MLGESDEFLCDDLAELEEAAGLPRYPADPLELADLDDDSGEWQPADGPGFTLAIAGGCLAAAVLGGLLVVAVLRVAFGRW